MFQDVHRAASLIRLVRTKLPQYAPLLREDLHEFRGEIVRTVLGACVAAVAGLLFVCFASIAVIISAWNGEHRLIAAWGVCLAWGALTVMGLFAAYKAASVPLPFRRLSTALADDQSVILALFDTPG